MIIQTNFVKFWGTPVDNTLSWKQHIATMIPKLNKTFCIIRGSSLFLSQVALKIVYFAFFHSVMSYGLIFWGNLTSSKCLFKLQKRAIRIIIGTRNNDSCRVLWTPKYITLIYPIHIFSVNVCI
jgi:hypothetical protein